MSLNRVQSFLSNERTLLAWVRTALAFFGLALGLANTDFGDRASTYWASILAVCVGVLAVVAYAEGLMRHGELERALHHTEFHLHRSHSLRPFWLAVTATFAATIAYCAFCLRQVAS